MQSQHIGASQKKKPNKLNKSTIQAQKGVFMTMPTPVLTTSQQQQTDDQTIQQLFHKSSSPIMCVWHLLFKASTFIVFYFFPLFLGKILFTKLFLIWLSITDFWIVKNLTARRLVGLRYWNEIDENNDDVWYFECYVDENNVNSFDKWYFWTIQFVYSIFYLVILVLRIISFNLKMLLELLPMVIGGLVNLYAFYQCSNSQQRKLKELLQQIKNTKDDKIYQTLLKGSIKMPVNLK